MPLEQYLPTQVFIFVLVFVRIAAIVMLLPGIGETFISMRIRLFFAVVLTLVIAPVVENFLPLEPPTAGALGLLVISEIVIGLYLGLIARILLLTLDTTGRVISFSIGLASAQVFNPSSSSQATLPGLILTMLGILMIFVTNLHHLMITAMVDSYQSFEPGRPLPVNDMGEAITLLVAQSFKIAVQLSAPFLIFSLLFFVALGVIARLMPQMQIFFVGLPVQIAVGVFMLSAILMVMMEVFLGYFGESAALFMLPR